MRHLLLTISVVTLGLTSVFGQTNEGLDQFSSFSPAAGKITRYFDSEGLYSCLFNFKDPQAEPNRDADVFATLYYEETPIAVVPASNYKLLNYDSVMDYVWQLSFFRVRPYEAPGNYSIVFDEGFFLLGSDKTPSKKVVANYTIAPYAYTSVPAEGVVTELSDIAFTLNGIKEIKVADTSIEHPVEVFDMFAAPNPDGTTNSYFPDYEINGNVLSVYLSRPIRTAGTWKVCVASGAFTAVNENGEDVEMPEINSTFVIKQTLNGIPSIDPEAGDIDIIPGVFTLTLPNEEQVATLNTMCSVYLYPVMEDGSLGASIARYVPSFPKDTEDKNRIILTNMKGADQSIKPTPGKYRLAISDKLYRISSGTQYMSAFGYDYTVLPSEVNCIVTPSSNEEIEALGEFTVEFPGATSVEILNSEPSWLYSSVANYIFGVSKVNDNTLKFSTQVPVTYPGEYTFDVANNSIKVDGEIVAIDASFKIGKDHSGVAKIETELPAAFNIYTIDGRIVKANASNKDLYDLEAGLYIVAGKKIIVK
ncbi:MAG: hypothetical protein NC328_04365 [Muribaculum sp.]|nr:hypothetical protein [Muribaculum sp.]